jgi:hypothetical protein
MVLKRGLRLLLIAGVVWGTTSVGVQAQEPPAQDAPAAQAAPSSSSASDTAAPASGAATTSEAESARGDTAADGTASQASPTAATNAPPADDEQWVATHKATDLWSDPDGGTSYGTVRPLTFLRLTGQGAETRLYVYNPRTQGYAWVDADAVGPATAPSDTYLKGPQVLYAVNKPGRVMSGYNLRTWPLVDESTRIRLMGHNTPVWVQEAVVGEDGDTWYRVGDDEYVPAEGVRLPKAPPRTFAGRWIDADLSEPTMVSAYEGDRLVYTALAIHGTASDPTPVGQFRIQRRVANEIMDSATVGIPRNSPRGYYLRNVLYTQYFTSGGASFHYNYWSSGFGYAGSHGCLGLSYDDSLWLWNWATVGTVVNIHY